MSTAKGLLVTVEVEKSRYPEAYSLQAGVVRYRYQKPERALYSAV